MPSFFRPFQRHATGSRASRPLTLSSPFQSQSSSSHRTHCTDLAIYYILYTIYLYILIQNPPSYSLFSLSVSLLQATGHVARCEIHFQNRPARYCVVRIMYFYDIKGNSTPWPFSLDQGWPILSFVHCISYNLSNIIYCISA